jgi:hypothetical protein
MATMKSIEKKLQERAPFLSVKRFKNCFSLVIEDQPFLLTECQKYLGLKLVDLSDDDIDLAINEAIPTIELVNECRDNLKSLNTTALADIHKAYNEQSWSDVGNLAFSLVGFEEQIKILDEISKHLTNK